MFPLWMALVSYFMLNEKITKRVLLALVISFIGLVLVLFPEGKFFSSNILGILSVLIAGFFAGLVYVMSKTFKTYDKFSLVFWQNIIATLFILPLFLINMPKRFSPIDSGLILIIGIATVIPFTLYYIALGKIKSCNAGVIMFLEGIIPIILTIAIFQEVPSLATFLGGILIFFGSYLTVTDK